MHEACNCSRNNKQLAKLRSGLSKEPDSLDAWKNAIIDQVKSKLIGYTDIDRKIVDVLETFQSNSHRLERGAPFLLQIDNSLTSQKTNLQDLIIDHRIKGVIQHETRSHISSDLLRYFLVSLLGEINGKSPKFSEWKGKLGSIKPNHSNIILDNRKLKSSSHSDRFKVQVWDKPANTIVVTFPRMAITLFIRSDPPGV